MPLKRRRRRDARPNAGIAGKSGPVKGENAGEAMHLHGGDQPCVVRRLSRNLVLDHQTLPNCIDRRRIWQHGKHAQAHQFGRRFLDREAQAVLRDGSRGDHPQLEEVLRNYVQLVAPVWQNFKCVGGRFVLGCRTCRVRSSVLVSMSTVLD